MRRVSSTARRVSLLVAPAIDRHPPGRGLDDRGHDPLALAVVQGLRLAGGAARHEEVDAFGDLPLDQRAAAPGSRRRRSR